ncbi:MAG: hypothetical protein COY38_05570 [Candidatus Aenigmarchaeota archaeon CG_4_10_14_0_8_um_filter_37_24]|nr:hypothetical protein [Candidatus Aenigmarchaeota archaeon]OIN85420.1 MAG: hypothetical protein AUJ50_05025 [Candidatus Aenigmarchaeota archaeon CG1_02_38_14]PIV68127.1 MAG: hypothetical protein COS07_05210 [Candidatus Aenigmarchaeota archaeon CG01_land_8_20_14_3_00_37_9]PIW40953.1 MAG: hypothetical protein COW21_04480 [Candidatus Aenigmarchaeota archaeon CG15_BIG_FIL_POST_REV_8_21_14_020_37_27]PIX50323.1 MAG: hypothetical protein COZ52_04855 [Candidatus Aenigmarchaeota archaeon CG_4_8_14_3_u
MREEERAWILFKLLRHWGGKHTSLDNLPKGQPKNVAKQIKEACKEMIKDGLILSKPTHYGLEISLNPRRKKEIIEIVSKYYDIPFDIF